MVSIFCPSSQLGSQYAFLALVIPMLKVQKNQAVLQKHHRNLVYFKICNFYEWRYRERTVGDFFTRKVKIVSKNQGKDMGDSFNFTGSITNSP